MARTRSIKPGFFRNESLSELPYQDRLCFAGLWTIADREGRLEDRPKRIRVDIFPYDPEIDVEACLLRLHNKGFIIRYISNSVAYICIPAWGKHQNPHVKEQPSTIPAPDEPGAKPEQAGPSTLLPITDSPITVNAPPVPGALGLVLDELQALYLEAGRPLAPKHRQLCAQYFSEIPAEKWPMVAGFVRWGLKNIWRDPSKTKSLVNVLRDGDWDVPIIEQRSKPVRRVRDKQRDSDELGKLKIEAEPWLADHPGATLNDFVDWQVSQNGTGS